MWYIICVYIGVDVVGELLKQLAADTYTHTYTHTDSIYNNNYYTTPNDVYTQLN